MLTIEDKFMGGMLGLALGDALGARFEGQTTSYIKWRYPSIDKLVFKHDFEMLHYTDDTQMAIGLAEALIEKGEVEEESLCRAFVTNYAPYRGYGGGARLVLQTMEDGGDYKKRSEEIFPGGSYGNGGAMRVAPVGLFFHEDLDQICTQAHLSAWPTHKHPLGTEGAELLALAVALVTREQEFNRESFFTELISRCHSETFRQKMFLAKEVRKTEDLLPLGNGILATDSVATAIACFALFPRSFEQVVAEAIYLGGDTDTIAAMAGAISGAFLGPKALPKELLDVFEDHSEVKGISYIRSLTQKLYQRWKEKPTFPSENT